MYASNAEVEFFITPAGETRTSFSIRFLVYEYDDVTAAYSVAIRPPSDEPTMMGLFIFNFCKKPDKKSKKKAGV